MRILEFVLKVSPTRRVCVSKTPPEIQAVRNKTTIKCQDKVKNPGFLWIGPFVLPRLCDEVVERKHSSGQAEPDESHAASEEQVGILTEGIPSEEHFSTERSGGGRAEFSLCLGLDHLLRCVLLKRAADNTNDPVLSGIQQHCMPLGTMLNIAQNKRSGRTAAA